MTAEGPVGVHVGARMAREIARAREARRCPPHPYRQLGWHRGDYATPDRLVCARCGLVLLARPHLPER